MIEHAAQFAAAGIPFIFDPGQGLPMFGGDELAHFIEQATWVAVNDYEWGMLQQKTGLTAADIASRVKALIVTRGAEGSVIYADGPHLGHSLRQAAGGGRSDRLRRCLPRWFNSWAAARS